ADADIDAANPRTRARAIPAGQLSRQFVLGFTVISGALFLLACAELNRLTLSAAWIAVRGSLDARILVLTAAVTLWVGGFDVLYACQDYEHDCQAGLYSLPRSLGIAGAFWAARLMHAAMLGLLVWFGILFHFRAAGWIGIAAVALLLAWEHSIVSPGDMRRLNAAFF